MDHRFLLITPEAVSYQSYYNIFRVLHQRKINGKPVFTFDSQIIPNARFLYEGKDPEVMRLIKSFDEENIKQELAQLNKIHAKQKSGISFEKYIERAAPRVFHEQFNRLKEIAGELKIYHRIRSKETGNYKVAPCTFSNGKAGLKFKINRSATNGLSITTLVNINDEELDISEFNQSAFLLEKAGVYYILSIKDTQTLEWLKNAEPEQYSRGFCR